MGSTMIPAYDKGHCTSRDGHRQGRQMVPASNPCLDFVQHTSSRHPSATGVSATDRLIQYPGTLLPAAELGPRPRRKKWGGVLFAWGHHRERLHFSCTPCTPGSWSVQSQSGSACRNSTKMELPKTLRCTRESCSLERHAATSAYAGK